MSLDTTMYLVTMKKYGRLFIIGLFGRIETAQYVIEEKENEDEYDGQEYFLTEIVVDQETEIQMK
jgi:hypothetical protein